MKEKRYSSESPRNQEILDNIKTLVDWIESHIPYCKERISAVMAVRNAGLWCQEAAKIYDSDGEELNKYRD